jgi:hypothetical protein
VIDPKDIPAATEEAVYILRALPLDAATAAIVSAASRWPYPRRRALVRALASQIIHRRVPHNCGPRPDPNDIAELLAQDMLTLVSPLDLGAGSPASQCAELGVEA